MSNLLHGDTALITGAASGIGRGIALALAREGARLVVSDFDELGGQRVANELVAEGASACFMHADLSTSDGAEKLLRGAIKELGQLSILVHSASPKREENHTADAVTDEQWSVMTSVNLTAGFKLGRGAAQHMRDAKIAGRILFITSLHANTPRNLPHYSAAKAGATMVMKELARAYGQYGIRVNALAPGAIPGGGFTADPATLTDKIALRRVGTPEDIGNAAIALLSDRFSGYVTGTTIVVDGGLSLFNWIAPAGD
ncbi:MAG: SDR family oxidoreductase [Pseudomonadota bacterium]|nr:SDR family oxidoreductase [Pseudomonadota bacterium]